MRIYEKVRGFFGSAYFKLITYDNLAEQHRQQVNKNMELSGDVGRLTCKNQRLSKQLEQRTLELKALNAKQEELNTVLAEAREDISKTLKLAYEVRTSERAMKERAEANAGPNSALVEWQKSYAEPLERRLNIAEQEAAALRSAAFSTAIDITLKRDPKIGEIPFAYYDFVHHGVYYTRATLDFLGAGKEEDTLTLRQLVGYIRKEDREAVIKSLESGKGLRHYKALTSGEPSKELILTTKPFVYDKKPVGVAIFLFDPKYSVQNLKDHLIYGRLKKLFSQMFGKFGALRENLEKKGKLEASL